MGQPLALPELTFQHEDFVELDFGFDFYAPQTTLAVDGRRILVGWMGLPDISYPSDRFNWAHGLTLPRELTLENQQLRQKPVRELISLRKETLYEQELELVDQLLPAQAEIFELELSQLQLSSDQLEVKLRVSDQEQTVLRYDQQTRRFTMDRASSGAEVPALDYGTTRSVTLTEPLHTLRVFVDRSSVEVFLNDGEAVASARIFPKTTSQGIVLTGDATAHLAIYSL